MAIGLVAHDRMKAAMVAWVRKHRARFRGQTIFATGQTGGRVLKACPELKITRLASGPLGGDQQLGALITTGELDALFFFIDPLSPHPHDVDVKALLRLAIVYDVPIACNAATATLLLAAAGRGTRLAWPGRGPALTMPGANPRPAGRR
jgi:methylglyoxal synthase